MLRINQTFALSILALAAATGVPGGAQAQTCALGIGSTGTLTCIGDGALANNSSGAGNSGFGLNALNKNTSGSSNTASGAGALQDNVSGASNVASGFNALNKNTTGSFNTAVGAEAAFNQTTTAAGNIALGYRAGFNWTTGVNNIAIGNTAANTDSATIRIGTLGVQTRAFIAGVRGVNVSGGQLVVVDPNGQLGVAAGLPGVNNTAIGSNAMLRNVNGASNAAFGVSALQENTTGSSNTAAGVNALFSNVSGSNNTAFGFEAALNQNGGSNNIALGHRAGINWSTGGGNIAIGNNGDSGDLATIRIGSTQTKAYIAGIRGNILNGGQAVVVDANGQLGVAPGSSPVPGDNNTALGTGALGSNTVSGNNNTASGWSALALNTVGVQNTANGSGALQANTNGRFNTASGANSLNKNNGGSANTANGVAALQENTTGNNNTASGVNALYNNTSGGNNTASGAGALFNNTTGSSNTAVGSGAGGNWTVGSNNIAVAAPGVAGEAATIRIGEQGVQTRTFIAGIRGTRVNRGQAVQVDANGQLGTSRSSIRYKEDVHSMGDASNPLMNLRPVTFRYKEAEPDGGKPIQYGLIAEEVEKVMPDLVIYNDKGTPESVAYEILPSLLLNEYQKQGRELAAAKARLEAMEAEMAAMRVVLNRLAAASSPQGSSFAALEPVSMEGVPPRLR